MTQRANKAEREQRRKDVQRYTNEGKSQQEIAEIVGVSRATVAKDLAAMRERKPQDVSRATAVAIARTSTQMAYGTGSKYAILPPPDHFSSWRFLDLDRNTWDKITPSDMMSILVNVSPEVSRAVWDWLRLANAGHEITAFVPGSDEQDTRAQEVLDDFIERLESNHGTFKLLAGRLFMGALTRGAFFAELVLDHKGRVPLDIATPDPATVRFKLKDVPDRGAVWVPGQWQDGKFVLLDVPTVIYIPLDPETDSPYGRPMLAPAIFPAVFLMGVLHDLRRVIAQQGYPRTDIVIKLKELKETYSHLNEKDFEKLLDSLIKNVQAEYSRLDPDDAFVHTDAVEVDRASGAVDSSAMVGSEVIIEVLERMATRALKTMPIMMGSVDGTGDANANRQWEIHAAGVRTVQHYGEAILSRHLTTALRVQGVNADVRVRFAEIRAAEELRDAQTFIAKLNGAELAEMLGFFTPDEAAEYATGHGIPVELADDREGLMGGDTGGAPESTDATQQDGDEFAGNSRVLQQRISADQYPEITPERVNAAVQTWRNAFAGDPLEALLDAELEDDE